MGKRRGSSWRLTALVVLAMTVAVGCDASTSPAPAPTPSSGDAGPPTTTGMLAGVVLPPSALTAQAERDELTAAAVQLTRATAITETRTLVADSPAFVRDMAGLLAREGRDPVCLVGPGSAAVMAPLTTEYPQTKFCALEARSNPPEGPGFIVGIRVEEGAYIAGVAAALASGADAPLGIVAAGRTASVERLRSSFEAGARTVRPEAAVIVIYLNESLPTGTASDDEANVSAAMGGLLAGGVTTVLTLAGDADALVLDGAEERGMVVSGVGATFGRLAESHNDVLLLTVMLRWERAFAAVAERLAAATWAGTLTLGLADNAVVVQGGGAPSFGAIAPELQARMARIVAGDETIASG